MSELPKTPRTNKVLALANKAARTLQHTYVGTEHLLLGIIREREGMAGRILAANCDIQRLENDILHNCPAAPCISAPLAEKITHEKTLNTMETNDDAFREFQEAGAKEDARLVRKRVAPLDPTASPRSHWNALIGRRLLVKSVVGGAFTTEQPPVEISVRELSPSGDFAKARWLSEEVSWIRVVDYEVVEELPSDVPVDATTLRAGAELAAREIWFRGPEGASAPVTALSIEQAIQQIMALWDFVPFGTLLGHDANGKPFSDVVNGSGPHHRAEFEQSVRAWLVVHWSGRP